MMITEGELEGKEGEEKRRKKKEEKHKEKTRVKQLVSS